MHIIACPAGSSAILLLSDFLVGKIFLHVHLDFERGIMCVIVHLDSISITYTFSLTVPHGIVILVPTYCQ